MLTAVTSTATGYGARWYFCMRRGRLCPFVLRTTGELGVLGLFWQRLRLRKLARAVAESGAGDLAELENGGEAGAEDDEGGEEDGEEEEWGGSWGDHGEVGKDVLVCV